MSESESLDMHVMIVLMNLTYLVAVCIILAGLELDGPRRVYFSRPGSQFTHPIDNDGIPFIISAHKQYSCAGTEV